MCCRATLYFYFGTDIIEIILSVRVRGRVFGKYETFQVLFQLLPKCKTSCWNPCNITQRQSPTACNTRIALYFFVVQYMHFQCNIHVDASVCGKHVHFFSIWHQMSHFSGVTLNCVSNFVDFNPAGFSASVTLMD